MPSMRPVLLALFLSFCALSFSVVGASPLTPTPTRKTWSQIDNDVASPSLVRRADPTFPPTPPSCPICAQSYPSINSCAQAAPAFANLSQIIFAPGEFISVLKCACTDTLQSAFPQCVDCFQQTNQAGLLDTSGDNIPSFISNLRSACGLLSTLLGNVTGANGEQVNGTPSAAPIPGAATAINPSLHSLLLVNTAMAILLAFAGSITL